MVTSTKQQPTPTLASLAHRCARLGGPGLLVALLVIVSATVGCRQLRAADGLSETDADVGGMEDDTVGSGGAPADGSGGQGNGGTVTGTGGASASSGGAAGPVTVDAGAVSGGSGGLRAGSGGSAVVATGGIVAVGSGGTGGVVAGGTGGAVVKGSGGMVAVGSGGVVAPPAGSGGAMTVDAGADRPPTCTGANHLCGASCVSNALVSSCGTSCTPCPVPSGGSATCDGNQCGVSCPGGKLCNGKCIAATACCADGDCPAQGGVAGKCNTGMNVCQYAGTTLYDFSAGITPWTLYMTSPERLASKSKLTFDAHNGEGNSGALKVEAPFDAGNQKVEFQDTQSTMLDLRGRTIHARVRLGSGLSDDTAHPGAIKLFAKSGANYDYASGVFTKLLGSNWVDVALVVDKPDLVQGTFAADQIRQIGFELRVFSDTQRPAPAVIYVDSIGN